MTRFLRTTGFRPLLLLLGLLSGGLPLKAAYEAEMAAFAAADAANPPPADAIVFTGSSTIRGWNTLAADFPSWPVLNRGFGGSQMNDVLEHYDELVTAYAPPLIVLYEGDNDIASGETPQAIFAEYVTFVDRVAADFPATDIIIVSVKPSPSRASFMPAMAELNGKLQDLCTARPNLRYADVFSAMLNNSGQPRPELFQSDMLHMVALGYDVWQEVLTPLVAAAPFSPDRTLLIDFGTAANAAGTGWNSLSAEIGTDPAGVLSSLVNPEGTAGTAGLEIVTPFNAANESGTTSSAVFPAAATSDSLFGNTELFGELSDVFPSFRLTGLDPDLFYRLSFYASRTGVTDNRETLYEVNGATPGTALLNASGNVDAIAIISGIRPDGENAITVSLSPGPRNNSSNHFTYLGALKVDGLPPPPADTTPPLLLGGTGRGANRLELQFSEALDPDSVSASGAWQVNGGSSSVVSASLEAGGRIVTLTVDQPLSGTVTVRATGVKDTAGNTIAAGSEIVIEIVSLPAEVLLLDFGGTGPVTDPGRTWNVVTSGIGSSATGALNGLVTAGNELTSASLRMIRRFNGTNTNGTTASTVFPSGATSRTLYGNTETFSGLADIFPAFALTGLDPAQGYDLTFYASRTGVSDNRQTRYTVTGAEVATALLQPANNIDTTATLSGQYPSAAGELIIDLTPGPANNNANHFTYLGVMVLGLTPDPDVPTDLLPARLTAEGLIEIDWTGPGNLERADSLSGPWLPVTPAPVPPFSEALHPSGKQFYRLRIEEP